MRLLISGGYVIPADGRRRIIKDGSVYVEDGRIIAVGRREEVRESSGRGAEEIDASGCVVIPGLIDIHVHLAQALIRGVVPDDVSLIAWLRDWVLPLQGVYEAEDGRVSASLCILEMLKTGTTCFLESLLHTRYGFNGIAEVVKSSGIRGILSKSIMDIPEYAKAGSIIPPGMIEEGPATLREFKEMHKRWAGAAGGRIDVWVGLRTPGAVSDELYREAISEAEQRGAGATMHLAEVKEDLEYFKSRGTTPSGFLKKLGMLGRKRVYVHCVWLSDDDINAFASTGTSVAHCPSSNLKLGSGIARVYEMLRAGVVVGLGCDGGPSNDSYDMIREMKLAAILQKGRLVNPTALSAWDALEMATINGARALGLEKEIGSLEPGKKADITIVSLRHPSVQPLTDPLSLLVYAATGRDVRDVIIDGRPVVRDGKVLTMDEERILREANQRLPKVLERADKLDRLL